MRIAQQLERAALIVGSDDDVVRLLRFERSADDLFLHRLECPAYLRQVAAEDLFFDADLHRCLLDIRQPLTRGDQIHRVDKVHSSALDAHHDLHLLVCEIFLQSSNAIAAIAECDVDRLAGRGRSGS
jgi:hypothetical protein